MPPKKELASIPVRPRLHNKLRSPRQVLRCTGVSAPVTHASSPHACAQVFVEDVDPSEPFDIDVLLKVWRHMPHLSSITDPDVKAAPRRHAEAQEIHAARHAPHSSVVPECSYKMFLSTVGRYIQVWSRLL